MFKAVAAWNRRRQSIRILSALSDRELADIGIFRGQIEDVVRQIPVDGEAVPAARARAGLAQANASRPGGFADQALLTRA